jgi:hypothetical protein
MRSQTETLATQNANRIPEIMQLLKMRKKRADGSTDRIDSYSRGNSVFVT